MDDGGWGWIKLGVVYEEVQTQVAMTRFRGLGWVIVADQAKGEAQQSMTQLKGSVVGI